MYEIIEIYEINTEDLDRDYYYDNIMNLPKVVEITKEFMITEIFKNIGNNIEKFIDRNLDSICLYTTFIKSDILTYEQSLKESDVSFQKKKKVKFNNTKYIYLIPYYSEITKSLDDIWWNENDLFNASRDATKKIKKLLDIHPLMTHKQAKKILYNPLSYDESNF